MVREENTNDRMKTAADGHASAAYVFTRRPALRLCVVAMLCAVGIVGRIALWTAPNIQPVTTIVIIISVYIGLADGIFASVTVPLVTNLIMGSLGLWTLYQSAGWVLVAVLSYVFFHRGAKHWALLLWAFAAGILYGFVVDLISWRFFLPETSTMGFRTYKLTSLLFDFYHALGNAVFMRFLEPLFLKLCLARGDGSNN